VTDSTGDVIFEILDSPISLPTFSPDGSRFAAVVADGVIHVWDTITHNLLAKSQKYSADIRSLVLSPNGTRIILICSYSSKMNFQIWLVTEDLAITLDGDGADFISAAFFPGGVRYLTSANNICIWDMPSTTPVLTSTLIPDNWSDYASISSDGSRLILDDGLWDLVNGRRITSCTEDATTAEFSPDCKLVVLGCYDGVHILDATTGAELYKSLFSPRQLSFSTDSTRLLVVCDDGHAQLLDLKSLPTSVGTEPPSCVYPPDCMMIQSQRQQRRGTGWYEANGTRLIWLPPNMRPVWLAQGKQPFGSCCLFLGSGNDVTVLDVNDYLEVLPAGVVWREAGVRYLTDPEPFDTLMSESGNKVRSPKAYLLFSSLTLLRCDQNIAFNAPLVNWKK
jgi:WD40 repeat protein